MAKTTTAAATKTTAVPAGRKLYPDRKLLKPERLVLGELVKVKGNAAGLSRRTIAERVGKRERLVDGRLPAETLTYGGLVAAGLIVQKQVAKDGDSEAKETVYSVTAAGRKALADAPKAKK